MSSVEAVRWIGPTHALTCITSVESEARERSAARVNGVDAAAIGDAYRRAGRRRDDPSESMKSERIITMVYGFHVDSV
jgi:hypothetical protein